MTDEEKDKQEFLNKWDRIIQEQQELTEERLKSTYKIMWSIPEISSFLSFYEVIWPAFANMFHLSQIPQFKIMDKIWIGFDGPAILITGITQLFDTQTHRQFITKLKGMANISSGVQVIVFAALLSPILPWAFAATAINDLILSFDPLQHEVRKYYSFELWLNDSFNQLDRLRERIDKMQGKIDALIKKINETPNIADKYKWLLEKRLSKITELKKEYTQISDDINNRLGYKHQKHQLDEKIYIQVQKYDREHKSQFLYNLMSTGKCTLMTMSISEAKTNNTENNIFYVWNKKDISEKKELTLIDMNNKLQIAIPVTAKIEKKLDGYEENKTHELSNEQFAHNYELEENRINKDMRKKIYHYLEETFTFSLFAAGWIMVAIPDPTPITKIAAVICIFIGTMLYAQKNAWQLNALINHYWYNSSLSKEAKNLKPKKGEGEGEGESESEGPHTEIRA